MPGPVQATVRMLAIIYKGYVIDFVYIEHCGRYIGGGVCVCVVWVGLLTVIREGLG